MQKTVLKETDEERKVSMGNVYIAGRQVQIKGKDVFQVAAAYAGHISTMNIPMENKSLDAVGIQAVCEVIRKVDRFMEEHPDKKGMIVKQGSETGISFKTNILSENVHETSNISYRNEAIYDLRQKLASKLNVPVGRIDVNSIISQNEDVTLLHRAFDAPGQDKSYRFKPDDLVICKGGNGESSSFNIYARVVSVDAENDTVLLDKYTGYGMVDWQQKPLPLLEMELAQMYVPMNKDEIQKFHQGLTERLGTPRKAACLYDRAITLETYRVVEKADKPKQKNIERE